MVFFLVVHVFIFLLGNSIWRSSSKALPLIWTVTNHPGLLLMVTVLPVILGIHFLMRLTAHADVLIPAPFIRCESATPECRCACLHCNEWLAPWHGQWKIPWNLCPVLLLGVLMWAWKFYSLLIHICKWSREMSQLLTNTLAILLEVWKDDSIFFHLSRKCLSQCKYLLMKCTPHFYTSIFFLLQTATWSIYSLCWLQIAYFFSSRGIFSLPVNCFYHFVLH